MKIFHNVVLIHTNLHKQKEYVAGHYLRITLFLLYGFGCIKASEAETFEKSEAYKQYFKHQEEIYHELLNLGIPGARPLSIDEVLAEEVLAHCPKEVKDAISGIQQSVFFDNEKDMILYGMSGTGKSCLAQAIAIKSQTPCLFFNVGSISTEYMNSGVQNLNRIFEYAQKIEKSLGKPCIIIFDELEALTKKHAGKNNHESNILISFWQELDKLNNSRVVVIGTMNRIEDLPVQITNRTCMIEVALPTQEHREAILSYYLKAKQNKYKLAYPEWATAAHLARQTKGFSNRDLQNVVARATKPAILAPAAPDQSNKFVTDDYFANVIKQIKKDPKRKLEREIGTWKHTLRTHFRDPKVVLPVAALATALIIAYNTISNQIESMAIQRDGHRYQQEGIALQKKSIAMQIAHQNENLAHQKEAMEQSQRIANYQTSTYYLEKQAKINSVPWWDRVPQGGSLFY